MMRGGGERAYELAKHNGQNRLILVTSRVL
jgi:hypothetical protein